MDDSAIEKWKEICYLVNSNKNAEESKIQSEMVHLFEKLGWKKYRDEIEEQRRIVVGSANSLKPDIIIKSENKDLFVVELKKPSAYFFSRNEEQLFSYMRQLKLKVGILLNDKLHVFYEDVDLSVPIEVWTVAFNESNTNTGVKFLEMFGRETYKEEDLLRYCANQISKLDAVDLITSDEYKEVILGFIKKDIEGKFNSEVGEFAIASIELEVTNKADAVVETKPYSPDIIPIYSSYVKQERTISERDEIEKVRSRVPRWFNKPYQTNCRILFNAMKYLSSNDTVSYRRLELDCAGITNFNTNFHAMANSHDKNHGKVFERAGDVVSLWPPVKDFIRELYASRK